MTLDGKYSPLGITWSVSKEGGWATTWNLGVAFMQVGLKGHLFSFVKVRVPSSLVLEGRVGGFF